jgi:hypothetical protein
MTAHGSRCLRDELTDYAAGRLTPVRRNHWDLHLVTCECCRAAVADERHLQHAMRLDTVAVPDQLRSSLLALALKTDDGIPVVPPAPARVRSAVSAVPLATLAPDAPAAHRSMVRPTLLATLAASAGAAAAIGLSIGSLSAPAAQVRPVARPASPAPTSSAPSYGAVPAAYRPGWSLSVLHGAQSTP